MEMITAPWLVVVVVLVVLGSVAVLGVMALVYVLFLRQPRGPGQTPMENVRDADGAWGGAGGDDRVRPGEPPPRAL
jgi:hypothetical protein